MQDKISSLRYIPGVDDLFNLMSNLINSVLNPTEIIETIDLAQKSFSDQIARCIELANRDSQYHLIGSPLDNIRCDVNKSFASVKDTIKFCIIDNLEAAEGCFDTMMHVLIHDLFFETMSGGVPFLWVDNGRYRQIIRQRFRRQFYRIRGVNDINCNELHPHQLFHIPYSLRQSAGRGRYSITEFPSLYLATDMDLAVSECGNPHRYFVSEFQSNYAGYEFPNSNNSLDIIMLALYHPLAIWFWISNSNHSFEYWFNILKRYLRTFPLIYSCSMKSQDKTPEKFEYFVPNLLMKWITKNKQFCDGVIYFPKAITPRGCIDLYKYNIALPAVPPYDDFGHSVNLKKKLHWSYPELKVSDKKKDDRIIYHLIILTQSDKDDEFINLCIWLNEHYVSYFTCFDESIEGTLIEFRQWTDVVDPRDANSIKFILSGFSPDELMKKLEMYGIKYLKD